MIRPALKLSNFYVKSTIFTVLSVAGAVFNYALYPVIAHVLNSSKFGDFTAILALSNQILGIMLTFNLVSIYFVKNFPEEEALHHAQTVQKLLAWFFLAATILTISLSPLLKSVLNIHSLYSFVILAIILLSSIPVIVWTGYLQGNKMLITVGLFNFTASLVKFIMAIIFAIWFGPTGGLFGVVIGTLAGLVILHHSAHIKLPEVRSIFAKFTREERKFLHNIKFYVLGAIFIVGGLSFLQNIDITYAKVLFSPNVAGVYSGVSILSNAIYYACFLLVWIILPEINPYNQKVNRRILKTGYKLIALIGVASFAVEYLFREKLTSTLLGSKFQGQGNIFVYATLFQISLVATTLLAYYLLIMRKSRVIILGALVILPCFILPFILAHNTRDMILTLFTSVASGTILFTIANVIFNTYRKQA